MRGIALVVDDVKKGPRVAWTTPARPSGEDDSNFARLLRPSAALCDRPLLLTVDGLAFIGCPVSLLGGDSTPDPNTTACTALSTPPVPADDRAGGDPYRWGDESDVAITRSPANVPPLSRSDDRLSLFNVVFVVAPNDALRDSRAPTSWGASAATSALLAALALASKKLAACLLHEERRCGYVTREVAIMLRDPVAASSSSRLAVELTSLYRALRGGLGSVCHLTINGLLRLSLSLAPDAAAAEHAENIAVSLGTEKPIYSIRGDVPLAAPPVAQMAPIRPYHTLLLLRSATDVLKALPTDASPQLGALVRAATPLRSFHELQGETGIPSAQLLRLAAHLVHWRLARISNAITSFSVYVVTPSLSPADVASGSPLAAEFLRAFGSPMNTVVPAAASHQAVGNVAAGSERIVGGTDDSFVPALHGERLAGSNAAGDGSVVERSWFPSLAAVLALFGRTNYEEAPPLHVAAGVDTAASSAPLQHRPRPTGKGQSLRLLMGSMSTAQSARFVEALVWLLKMGLLTQLHTHVYLLWPERAEAESSGGSGNVGVGFGGHDGLAGIKDWGGAGSHVGDTRVLWRPEDRAMLDAASAAAPDAEVAALMRRLVVYLRETMAAFAATSDRDGAATNGSSDDLQPALQLALRVEEVMWRLRVTRESLRAVLRSFPQLFVTATHD